jgi:hypothetical protein
VSEHHPVTAADLDHFDHASSEHNHAQRAPTRRRQFMGSLGASFQN